MNTSSQPIRYANYSGADLDHEKRQMRSCITQAEELAFATPIENFSTKLNSLVDETLELINKLNSYSSLNAKYITSRLDESLECLRQAQELLNRVPSDLDSAKSAIISFRDASTETIKAFPRN